MALPEQPPPRTDPFARLPIEILQRIRSFVGNGFWNPVWDGSWTDEGWAAYWPRGKPLRPMEIHLANVSATWCRLGLTEKYRKIAISFGNVQRLLETMERLPYLADSVSFATTNLNFNYDGDWASYDPPQDIISSRFWFDFPDDGVVPDRMAPALKLMDRVFVDRRRLLKLRAECDVSHYTDEDGDLTSTFRDVGNPPCEERLKQGTWDSYDEDCQYCHIKATNPIQLPWQSEHYPPDVRIIDDDHAWVDRTNERGDTWRLTSGPLGKGQIEGMTSWDDWHRLTAEVIKRCKPAEFMWDAACHPVPQVIIDALTSYESLEMFSCWSHTAEEYCDRESYISASYRPLVARCESLELGTDALGAATCAATPAHEVLVELLLHAKRLKYLHLGPSDGPVSMDGRLLPLFSTLHTLRVMPEPEPIRKPAPPRQIATAMLRSVLLDKAASVSPADLRLNVEAVFEAAASEKLRPIEEDLHACAAEVVERWNASDRGPSSTDPHATRLKSSYSRWSSNETHWWTKG